MKIHRCSWLAALCPALCLPGFFLSSGCASAQPPHSDAPPLEANWKELESACFDSPVQLTLPADFVKAGEAYFDPSGRWIVFQAVARTKEGTEPDPFYAMYVARLVHAGGDASAPPTGLDMVERVSPETSANTCGWFHPNQMGKLLFGTTTTRPADDQKAGFQVGTRKYVWMFPQEMDVATFRVRSVIVDRFTERLRPDFEKRGAAERLPAIVSGAADGLLKENAVVKVIERPNYDAECSYDPTGRYILYTHIEDALHEGRPDGNIFIRDTKANKDIPIIVSPGYDGGPFYSPDGRSICYRSDREGDDKLQLFVADLRFEIGADGIESPVGIEKEYPLTKNGNVNWCPFWHPSGKYLVFGTSEVGHYNYEVFAVETDMAALRAGKDPLTMRRVRVTHGPGADILPAFSNDGNWLLWTSQRGGKIAGEERPGSHLWIARWKGVDFDRVDTDSGSSGAPATR